MLGHSIRNDPAGGVDESIRDSVVKLRFAGWAQIDKIDTPSLGGTTNMSCYLPIDSIRQYDVSRHRRLSIIDQTRGYHDRLYVSVYSSGKCHRRIGECKSSHIMA